MAKQKCIMLSHALSRVEKQDSGVQPKDVASKDPLGNTENKRANDVLAPGRRQFQTLSGINNRPRKSKISAQDREGIIFHLREMQ